VKEGIARVPTFPKGFFGREVLLSLAREKAERVIKFRLRRRQKFAIRGDLF